MRAIIRHQCGIATAVSLCLLFILSASRGHTQESRPGLDAPTAERAVTIALGGDVMLARLVSEALVAHGPAWVWGDVRSLLRDADLAIVNLECVIAEGGERFEPRRVFYFRADPLAVEALTSAGIDGVALANNHMMDYRGPALLESLERLDEAGISHAGAGADREQAARAALLDAGWLRVALLSFADHFREYGAGPSTPGTNVIRIDARGLEHVTAAVVAEREAGADLVIVSIHWGPNMREVPSQDFVTFARAVVDAGADIFHGHSAHVFQGIEVRDGRLILYDTGDLVDDYRVDESLRNDRQLLYVVHADDTGLQRLELFPVAIRRMQTSRAEGDAFDFIEARLRRLSAPFGTEIERRDDRLVIEIGAR